LELLAVMPSHVRILAHVERKTRRPSREAPDSNTYCICETMAGRREVLRQSDVWRRRLWRLYLPEDQVTVRTRVAPWPLSTVCISIFWKLSADVNNCVEKTLITRTYDRRHNLSKNYILYKSLDIFVPNYRPLFLYVRNIKTYINFGRARALGYTKTY
jgi:hypothetical protein